MMISGRVVLCKVQGEGFYVVAVIFAGEYIYVNNPLSQTIVDAAGQFVDKQNIMFIPPNGTSEQVN